MGDSDQQLHNGDLDGAANLLMASTSEERPSTPDRPDFERQLSELNVQISKCHKELNELLGKHGMESELRRQIGLLRESKQLRDTEKIAARRQEPEIDTIKKELAEKVKIINELENTDLVYKKEDRLDAKIKELEDRYNKKGFTNVRDEQALVKEIDKLKRNKLKLAKYNAVQDQRKVLDDRLKVCQDTRKKAYTSARRAHSQYKAQQLKVGALKTRIESLKGRLGQLYPEKSRMLESYDKQRVSYVRWSRQTKQPAVPRVLKTTSLPSSRSKYNTSSSHKPAPLNKFMESENDFDDERLELFHEQKSRCRRLIAYLRSLLQQLDAPTLADLHLELDDETIDKIARPPLEKAPSSDSADDLPEGFTRLRRPATSDSQAAPASSQPSQLVPGSPKHKKRGSKKSSKKATQPISHSVELYQSFAELEIEVPSVYQEVPVALKKVQERLAFFELQTNLPNAEDPLDPYGLRDLHFDYPPSESDVTSDSGAWGGSFYSTDRSESASQFSLSQSAIVSPGDPSDGARPLGSCLLSPPISPTDDSYPVVSRVTTLTREQLHNRMSRAADSEKVISALNNMTLARQPTNDEGVEFASKESSANSTSAPVLSARQSSGIGHENSAAHP